MSVPQDEAAVAEPCGYVYEQDVSSSLAVTSWVKEEWRKKAWKERGRGREATRKTGQEPKTRREGREKVPGAPEFQRNTPREHPVRTC